MENSISRVLIPSLTGLKFSLLLYKSLAIQLQVYFDPDRKSYHSKHTNSKVSWNYSEVLVITSTSPSGGGVSLQCERVNDTVAVDFLTQGLGTAVLSIHSLNAS